MNRAQRRAKAKSTPAYRRGMTAEDMRKAFVKNGITPEDLQQNYEIGLSEGRTEGIEFAIKTVYAASALALNEIAGWGHKRCARFMRRMDEIVTTTITSDDVIEDVFEKCGLRIDFREALSEDRITEREA